MENPSSVRRSAILTGIAVAYFLSARAGLALATYPAQVTAIWPPAGVALAAMIIFGSWVWPAIAAGAFAANAVANESIPTALLICIGNTLEAVIGAWLLRRICDFRPALSRVRDVVALMVFAAPLSAIVAASIGVTSLLLGGNITSADTASTWRLWWLGDGMGMVVLAPVLLTWCSEKEGRRKSTTAEIAALFLALTTITLFEFRVPFEFADELKFLIFPFMIWSAYRFGQRLTSLAVVLVSVVAILGLLHHFGAMNASVQNERLLILQGFVGVLALTCLTLGSLVNERHAALAALEASQHELEDRVRQKTAALEEEIGARKKAEQDLQTANNQLEERVQTRTDELGRVSSDFRRSEQRMQAIIDNSNAIIFVKDREGRYLLVNREWETANKLERSAVIGRTAREIYPADVADRLIANDTLVMQSKEGIQFEESVPDSAGRIVSYIANKFPLLDAAGDCYAISGISTDITQRKRDEQAVLDSEARKTAMLESALDCIITMDARGVVVEWNPAAERTFGYTKAEAIGREMAELIIPSAYRGGHRRGLANYLKTGEEKILNKRLELTAVRKDGSEFPVEVAITRVPLGGGPIFTGYLRDITERKDIRERELRAREQAEAANRTKDEFLAVVSHELRTPLTPILGWTRIMRTYPHDDKQTARALEVIERNVRAQGKLVEDLLDISRIVTGKLRLEMNPMELKSVILAAVETVRASFEAKHITLDLALGTASGPMVGDHDRIQQVVWNLLSNAIKFTPNDGRIRIELRDSEDQVELAIVDNGLGIPADYLPQMFNRFSQADSKTTRKFGGLGLGLAIVRHIVEMHGGAVTASSAGPGKGATFNVVFPTHNATVTPGDKRPHYATPLRGNIAVPTLKGISVIAIDDERDTLDFIKAALQLWGAEVVTCGTAIEALGLVEKIRPSIVICDLGMPEIDGFGMIARLRALPPGLGGDTPAIALTAYARAEDRKRLLSAGFQMHIAKPIDPGDLVMAVSSVLGMEVSPTSQILD